MKFSVLIAHYNNSVYFKDCYQSLLEQTYTEWEAIILDDFSREEEKNAVKEIIKNDKRFIFHENKANFGVGYTKNKLIELSNGEICGFVDPDDSISPDAIELSVSEYLKNEIVATYSQFYSCNHLLEIEKIFPNSRKIKNGNPLFFNVDLEVAHFFTFKKSTYITTSGIDSTLSSSVDQDLYLKLYEIGNFAFIKKPLYFYRIHQMGVSQDKSKKNKLYDNWHKVILNSAQRREIKTINGKNINVIENLPTFIFRKNKSIISKIIKKFK